MVSSSLTFWGSGFVPVVYLEVIPVVFGGRDPPSLSNFAVKHFLVKLSEKSLLSLSTTEKADGLNVEWWLAQYHGQGKQDSDVNWSRLHCCFLSRGHEGPRAILLQQRDGVKSESLLPGAPLFFLKSNDPTKLDPEPCIIRAYAPGSKSIGNVIVTVSTLVRILPPEEVQFMPDSDRRVHYSVWSNSLTFDFHRQLSGESGDDFLSEKLQEEVFCNHNPETIRELSLRMSMQCSQPIQIGTTHDAFSIQRRAVARGRSMQLAIQSRFNAPSKCLQVTTSEEKKNSTRRSIPWEPSLFVYSPNHADGKTMLVQAIARQIGCTRIHVIRPGPLIAKYGIHADAALESLLHGILVSAAMQSNSAPICIILDHLDAMMPPQLSGRSGAGDAAVPVFNAIASYLRNVTGSLQRANEFPFPLKNPMYNVGGSGGQVVSVRVCLVGIVTCPDDGWRSLQRGVDANASLAAGGGSSTILDCLVGGRYRLSPLTAATRYNAFCHAFDRTGVLLDQKAQTRLKLLAASAAWAKGSAFQRVADILGRAAVKTTACSQIISSQVLEDALAFVQSNSASFAAVSFQPSQETTSGQEDSEDLFASVGGNLEAKRSLEDALAMDPEKRRLLARFGISPPTGVLLYGPPGTGKTLLAKAVARLLKDSGSKSTDSLPLGGTFISLGASDLVRAEVGTSEKMLVSAFDFADKNAPSVVFLDEFQALFTERSRGGSGKLTSTLLQCLDDVKRWTKSADAVLEPAQELPTSANRVVVLAATNTPWMIDSAFLRPGRFDRVVHVGLPTLSERESILMVHACRMKTKARMDDGSLGRLCRNIAESSHGFSGADLAALCRAAAVRALWDGQKNGDDCWIEESHFLEAINGDIQASSDEGLVTRLLEWRP